MHVFFLLFRPFQAIPVFDFGLANYASEPFNYTE